MRARRDAPPPPQTCGLSLRITTSWKPAPYREWSCRSHSPHDWTEAHVESIEECVPPASSGSSRGEKSFRGSMVLASDNPSSEASDVGAAAEAGRPCRDPLCRLVDEKIPRA